MSEKPTNGRRHSSRTNVLKFQEIDEKLEANSKDHEGILDLVKVVMEDVKIIKTELLGSEEWKKPGLIAEHRANTIHRKVTAKLWIGLWILIPSLMFIFSNELHALITLISP